MPSNGFRFFANIKNPIRIESEGYFSRCTESHTCINTFDLPQLKKNEELIQNLLVVINVKSFDLK